MIEPNKILRSSRRSLALTINEKGDLIIHAPKNMPLEQIFNFIEKKQNWIETKQNSIKHILNDNKDIINYNTIFFLGKKCKVFEVLNLETAYLLNNTLCIPNSKGNLKKKIIYLKEWYIKNIDKILVPRIEKLSKLMKQSFNQISIISSKRKWGMCSVNRDLFFNYKLLMLTPDLIDYVIIHELAHLIELNHSKKFWNIVKATIPNYKKQIEMLKQCGFIINLM